MNFKANFVAACGLVGLLAAGASQAITAIPNTFFISGSTALDNQLRALFDDTTNGPCTAGTIIVYTDIVSASVAPVAFSAAPAPGVHNVAFTCNLRVAIGGLTATTPVSLVKESNGGSYEGAGPVADQSTLQFINTKAAFTCTGLIGTSPQYPNAQQQDGCATTAIAPTMGVSDENPDVYNIGAIVSKAQLAKLNSVSLFQNEFAVGVSLNLYRALQRAQGIATLDDKLADMPSLGRQEIAALFSGNMPTWAGVTDAAGASVTTHMTTVGETLKDNTVWFCKRPESSGTNASADIYFLRNRCGSNIAAMAVGSTTNANCNGLPSGQTPEIFGCKWTSTNITDAVFPGTGTGDDVSCLNAHDVNNEFAIAYLGSATKFDDPNGLGGSTDTVGTSHFRLVAIDGKKPTLQGLANGTYDYAFDNTLNYPKTLANPALGMEGFIANVLQTAEVASLVTTQSNSGDANYGVGGLLDAFNNAGVAQNTSVPVTLAQLQGTGGTPVSAYTFALGSGVNDCQQPVAIGPVLTKEPY